MTDDRHACPSGRGRVGAHLLGFQTGSGLAFVDPPLPVTPDFLERVAATGGEAEARFRFTEPCVERGCAQWGAKGCGVIEKLLSAKEEPGAPAATGDVPPCALRSRCRWFAQRGGEACRLCTYVVTDNRQVLVPITLE